MQTDVSALQDVASMNKRAGEDDLYQEGTRNIVDVLDAQSQLYTSVRDYNNTCYDNLRLKQAAGSWQLAL